MITQKTILHVQLSQCLNTKARFWHETLTKEMREVGAGILAHVLPQGALLRVHAVHRHQQLLILKPHERRSFNTFYYYSLKIFSPEHSGYV